jgi:signal peptidase
VAKEHIDKAKRVYRRVTSIVSAIAFVVVLIAFVYLLINNGGASSLFGYRLYFIQTDSMTPTIKVGDIILSQNINFEQAKQIKAGDVVTYIVESGTLKGLPNTHRCVEAPYYDEVSDKWVLKTKGDKDGAPDEIISLSSVQSQMVRKLDFISSAYSYMRTTTGMATIMVGPLLLFLILSGWRLVDLIRRKPEKQPTKEEKDQLLEQAKAEIAKKAVEEYIAIENRKQEIAQLAIEEYLKSRQMSSIDESSKTNEDVHSGGSSEINEDVNSSESGQFNDSQDTSADSNTKDLEPANDSVNAVTSPSAPSETSASKD